MSYRVTDEEGWTWLVDKNDPAEAACKLLTKTGFRILVLPRDLLITGDVTKVSDEILQHANNAIKGLELVSNNEAKLPAKTVKELTRRAEHAVRLVQCLEVLAA